VEDKNTILGISIGNSIEKDDVRKIVTTDSSFFDFTSILLNRVIKNIMFSNEDAGIIQYEICFFTEITTLDKIMEICSSKDVRKKMIVDGCERGKDFYTKIFHSENL
jgi:hypothetical protein